MVILLLVIVMVVIVVVVTGGGGDSGGCVRKFGDSEWSMWSEYEYCIIISGP